MPITARLDHSCHLSLPGRRSRQSSILVMIGALLAANSLGCATQRALHQHTVAANVTVSDIYYQQVLNNIALFVDNPASMPSISVVTAGTVNVQDQVGGNVNPTYSPTLTS